MQARLELKNFKFLVTTAVSKKGPPLAPFCFAFATSLEVPKLSVATQNQPTCCYEKTASCVCVSVVSRCVPNRSRLLRTASSLFHIWGGDGCAAPAVSCSRRPRAHLSLTAVSAIHSVSVVGAGGCASLPALRLRCRASL
jgi:hypothetical protein